MKPGMEGHSFPQPPAANYPNLAGVASGENLNMLAVHV